MSGDLLDDLMSSEGKFIYRSKLQLYETDRKKLIVLA